LLVAVLVLSILLDPGSKEHRVEDAKETLPIQVAKIKVKKSNEAAQVGRIVVTLLIFFVLAHVCIRQMLTLTISYYEPLMIFAAASIAKVAKSVELF